MTGGLHQQGKRTSEWVPKANVDGYLQQAATFAWHELLTNLVNHEPAMGGSWWRHVTGLLDSGWFASHRAVSQVLRRQLTDAERGNQ
ncbi:hypothetical protein ACFQZ4_43815 [Catellatospora coxensis]